MDQDLINRKKHFLKNELELLKNNKYISEELNDHIVKKHADYYDDLSDKAQPSKNIPTKETIPTEQKVAVSQLKAKYKPSKQQVRDRNITWSLILGVILLLIGGLVLATSTWETLNSLMKTVFIGLVSIVFYSLALFTHKVLKINKTAFSFIILGSLLLPIIFISIGFFELFGSYLSLNGDGKFILGAIGSMLILPIYLFFALKLTSRLFVWFSYIIFTLFVAFILAAFKLPVDGFYLSIMLFNTALIFGYHKLKEVPKLKLFIKEFIPFIQTNLIFTSLLLLVFYDNEVFYGINVIITAIIYFSMIYVSNQKGYHYVFTVMLVYGAYQVIEFSQLHYLGPIGYAFLGVIFLGLPKLVKEEGVLKRVFQYTSAFISGTAFIYITLQAVFFRMDYPSFVMFIAYIVIALNFIYLTNTTKKKIFAYLAPIFLLVASYEIVLLSENIIPYNDFVFPMFIASLIIYIALGCFVKLEFLKSIRNSSRDVTSISLLFLLLAQVALGDNLKLGYMFLLLSMIALVMHLYEDRKLVKKVKLPELISPITFGLAIYMFYLEAVAYTSIKLIYQAPFGFVLASAVIFAISFLWKKRDELAFYNYAFFTATSFYLLSFLSALSLEFHDGARTIIALGAIFIAYLIYLKTKLRGIAYVISSFTFLFYFITLFYIQSLFDIKSEVFLSLEFTLSVVFLLLIGLILNRFNKELATGFWWVAHINLPYILLVTLLLYGSNAFWPFALATIIYVFTMRNTKQDVFTVMFLYCSYISSMIMMLLYANLIDLAKYAHYAFFIMSVIIFINWFLTTPKWKKRIAAFFIPFSIIGLTYFAVMNQIDLLLYSAIFALAIGILYILYQHKWTLFKLIPLTIVLYALTNYDYSHGYKDIVFVRLSIYACILIVVGQFIYKKLYVTVKEKLISLDAYTIIGFLSAFLLYGYADFPLWQKLLPGILITLFIILQRNRIKKTSSKWVSFIAAVFVLQPYYTLLDNIYIHALFIREVYVLPWIALVIILGKVADRKQRKIINYFEWAVLVIVALLLIQDGLASNTVYDALIIGTLSLASILGGIMAKRKSFFFVGVGVLLLNVFIQTKPYWGNLEWWAYLLIAGTILITVASLNEWNKQKSSEGKITFVKKIKSYIDKKLNEWQ